MKFEVGEKVRIIGPKTNQVWPVWPKALDMTIGLIGTVENVSAMSRTYLVETQFTRYWYSEEWLAQVKEEKKSSSKLDLLASLVVTDVAKNPKPYPKHIYKGEGKTVVMWEDGTKTIVKRAEGEPDNDYAAFTAALAIKIFGDNSKVNRIVRMTETVEKRKKKKKQKEDAEGQFEVIKSVGGENKFESTGITLSDRKDAEYFVDIMNAAPNPDGKYYVREKGEE